MAEEQASGLDPDKSKGWVTRAIPLVRAHWALLSMAMLSSVLTVVAVVLFPLVLGEAIDGALAAPEGQRRPLDSYLWELTAIAAIGVVAGFGSRSLSMRLAYALEFDLRTLLYRKLVELSASFYDRVRTGELISRANSDVRALQMLLAFAPFVVVQVGMFVLALCLMLRIDVLLTVLGIVVLPLIYLVGRRMRRRLFPVSWLVQSRTAEIASIVDENVSGAQVIRAFVAQQAQVDRLAQAAEGLRWATLQQIAIRARYGPVMENLVRVGEAMVLLYGGFLVLEGRIGPGDIVVFLSYLVMLQAPFRVLGMIMTMIQRAAASAHRIYAILDEKPAIADGPGVRELSRCRGEVEFRDVRFSFTPGIEVLRGFTLRVSAGETVALVGATGSGKTAAVQLVPRLYEVDGGAVLLDGHDVRDLAIDSLRRHVGICFEEAFLFSASIRDNIAYGAPEATDANVVHAATVAGAHDFITALEKGYETVVGERGSTLSGGQRQRIAIARVVLANPRVLILDDATSAIDVRTEQEIHVRLQQLLRQRTTIIVAHRLSSITLADRVALVEGGRVIATGTHGDLLATEPRYAEALAHLEDQRRDPRGGAGEGDALDTTKVELPPLDVTYLDGEAMR